MQSKIKLTTVVLISHRSKNLVLSFIKNLTQKIQILIIDNSKDEDLKKEISKYVSGKLKSVCHISVSNKHRGKGRNVKKDEYIITGLDVWGKGKIDIPKNEWAERLYVEKNFKRIMNKTKVGNKLWKYISELVEV